MLKDSTLLPTRVSRWPYLVAVVGWFVGGAASEAAGPTTSTGDRALRFQQISVERNLLDNTVFSMAQDRLGYLWVGTHLGLNRYDGYRFEALSELTAGLTAGAQPITALLEDRAGRLWIGSTEDGLYRWDALSARLSNWPTFRRNEAATRLVITRLAEARDGSLWVGTEDHGVLRAVPELDGSVSFEAGPIDEGRITALMTASEGDLWIGTQHGVAVFDGASVRRVELAPPGDPLPISALAEGARRTIWVGTQDRGVFHLSAGGSILKHVTADSPVPGGLPSNRIQCLYVDPETGLWIGTRKGLVSMTPEGAFRVARYDPFDPASLSDDSVRAIFQDRSGVLWIGTQNGGLNKLAGRASPFAHLRRNPDAPQGLGSNRITAVAEDASGDLWIGTFDGGLHRGSPTTGEFEAFRGDREAPFDLPAGARVMSLHVDSSDHLWIGTLALGLFHRDPESGRFELFANEEGDPSSLSYNGVTVVREALGGGLWVGTFRGGLNRLDPGTGRFQRFPVGPGGTSSGQIRALVEESPTSLWVGTGDAGLDRVDPVAGTSTNFRHRPGDPASLPSDSVLSLHLGSDGTLWIGTDTALVSWPGTPRHEERAGFTTFGEAEGLLGAPVWGLLEDHRGHLWLSTNRGLSRFDPASETFTNFGRSHGLPRDGFKFGTHHAGADGMLYFGSNSGITILDPSQVPLRVPKPPVVINRLLADNEPLPGYETIGPPPSRVEIDFRTDVLAVEFALLDYLDPDLNRFEYRLEGLDEDWVELQDGRRATFTKLPPGAYTLRVRGANSEGIWSAEEARLDLRVEPAPWATWWAYSLYGLLGAAAIYLYAHGQKQKLDREAGYAKRLELEVHARTRALEEQNERLQYANRLLEIASVTDTLTGVRNRRFLLTNVERDIAQIDRLYTAAAAAGRTAGETFVFLLVDLDGFKAINDRYGHSAGDLVLFQIRDLLNKACRTSDTLVRWGGDEFMIIGRSSSRENVEGLAERVRAEVAGHPFDIGSGKPVRLTCSIGFAGYPFIPTEPERYSWEEVVELADKALFYAKRQGSNMWVGVFGTESTHETPLEDLLALFSERPDLLAAEGSIDLRTSSDEEAAPLRTGT